jgi:hypothetical protein
MSRIGWLRHRRNPVSETIAVTHEPVPTHRVESPWTEVEPWSAPQRPLREQSRSSAFGAPENPRDAGRRAVDKHGEDLLRLADA